MNLRKLTSRIVIVFSAVVVAGSMIMGCSNDEFEGSWKTLATRSTVGTEPGMLNENSRWKITDSHLDDFVFSEEDSLFEFRVPVRYDPGQVFPIDETNLSKKGEYVIYQVKNAAKDKYEVSSPSSFVSNISQPKWRRNDFGGFEFTVSATIDYTVTIYPLLEIKTDSDGVPYVKRVPDFGNPILIEGSHVELSKVHHGVSQPY